MQRPPRCPFDIKRCTFPSDAPESARKTHNSTYHSPQPVVFKSEYTIETFVVHRDPSCGYAYPCPHPKCNHASLLASAPKKHHKTCRYFREQYPIGAVLHASPISSEEVNTRTNAISSEGANTRTNAISSEEANTRTNAISSEEANIHPTSAALSSVPVLTSACGHVSDGDGVSDEDGVSDGDGVFDKPAPKAIRNRIFPSPSPHSSRHYSPGIIEHRRLRALDEANTDLKEICSDFFESAQKLIVGFSDKIHTRLIQTVESGINEFTNKLEDKMASNTSAVVQLHDEFRKYANNEVKINESVNRRMTVLEDMMKEMNERLIIMSTVKTSTPIHRGSLAGDSSSTNDSDGPRQQLKRRMRDMKPYKFREELSSLNQPPLPSTINSAKLVYDEEQLRLIEEEKRREEEERMREGEEVEEEEVEDHLYKQLKIEQPSSKRLRTQYEPETPEVSFEKDYQE